MSKPKLVPQLEQDVRTELDRLKRFMQDVDQDLDGSLAKRNLQMEQAVTFALEHMNHVLSECFALVAVNVFSRV